MRRSRTPVPERALERGILAAVVTARRGELSLRQTDLAELAGCGNRFVADLEAGKTTLRLDKLHDVLKVLGLRLLLDDGQSGGPVDTTQRLNSTYGLHEETDGRAT